MCVCYNYKFNFFLTSTRTSMKCYENTSVSFECSRYTNKNFVSLIALLAHWRAHTHSLTHSLIRRTRPLSDAQNRKKNDETFVYWHWGKFLGWHKIAMCARNTAHLATLHSYPTLPYSRIVSRMSCGKPMYSESSRILVSSRQWLWTNW